MKELLFKQSQLCLLHRFQLQVAMQSQLYILIARHLDEIGQRIRASKLLPYLFRPCSVCHDFGVVLFPIRIGKSPLSPPSPPLADAAYGRDPDECEYDGDDGGVNGDFGACGELRPALSYGLGWWAGKFLRVSGVAAMASSVYRRTG